MKSRNLFSFDSAQLIEYDRKIYVNNIEMIAGIDEAGRGALAGPVVAACVAFRRDEYVSGVNDSKKLSPQIRERLYLEILKKAVAVGVGIVDNLLIEEKNILNATKLAMSRAFHEVGVKPDILLIDALELHEIEVPQKKIIKGDQLSHCIAAASIIAKVTRDRLMIDLATQFPQYKFEKHKGYGTFLHRNEISLYGLLPIHRKSFCQKILARLKYANDD